jgi:hypothetical protein
MFKPIVVALASAILLLPAVINAAETPKPVAATQAPVSTPISFDDAARKTLAAHP